MFAFVNPICWLKKLAKPNPNTKKVCDPLSPSGLVSQLGSLGFNPSESGSWWAR